MTSSDYYVVMRKAGIAELKAHLSEYLRAVRRGEEVTVFDRETPIARIVRVGAPSGALRIRPARSGAPPIGKTRLAAPLARDFRGIDAVELLLEDRRKR